MASVDERLDSALRRLGSGGRRIVVAGFGEAGIFERTRGYTQLFGWHEVRLEADAGVPPAAQLESVGLNHIDVLHVEAPGHDWSILQQIDLQRFRPAVVRLRRTNLPRADLFAVVRHLERHGYSVEWFYDEVIGLLPQEALPPAEPGSAPEGPAGSRAQAGIALYVISYNAPEQFRLWLESVERANPEILDGTVRFLLDNSTDEATRDGYDRLCAGYGFSLIRRGNLGISGGRAFCAAHFDALPGAEALLWFEDDMLLHPPDAGHCRNGLRTHVPDLLATCGAIARREDLDFLKLSFTEFFGDHHLNWAWYNVSDDVRERDFPGGVLRTRIEHSGVAAGVSYLVGEIHYSNWPTFMSRRGNARLFLHGDRGAAHESLTMARCFELQRRGQLRAAVLLASPVNHCRRYDYPADQRREC